MRPEVFDTILAKYIIPYRHVNVQKDGRPTFIGHKDGEPLLNKRITEYWSKIAAACPDMGIDLYTHGLLLPKWSERGHDIFEFLGSLPNKCRVLVSFHFNNGDGTTNDYTEASAYLKDAIPKRARNVEVILASHLVAPMTRERLDEWKASWAWTGIDVHANVNINPWTGRITDPNVSHFSGCPYSDFGHWFVGVTGNIIACCLDLEEEIVFGNVMTDEPRTMFHRLRVFYAEQRAKVVRHSVCHNCHGLPPAPKLQSLGVMV